MSIMNNHDFLPDIYSIRPKFTHYVRKFSKKKFEWGQISKKLGKKRFF